MCTVPIRDINFYDLLAVITLHSFMTSCKNKEAHFRHHFLTECTRSKWENHKSEN